MTPLLHVRLFGACHLTYDDQPAVPIRSGRVQSLLTFLLLHAQTPHLRQHLAYQFWPESAESQAHSNLRKLFYQLRQALPDAERFLVYDRFTIQWNPQAPYATDVGELDQLLAQIDQTPPDRALLTRSVALYQGELLPDCYDDWVIPLRRRYERSIWLVLTELVALLESRQAYGEGAHYAERLLELDPMQESSYRRLMRLRALMGDHAGALRTYHDCVSVLKQEFGATPDAETERTFAKIRDRMLQPPPKLSPQSHDDDTGALVGRVAEWQRLLTIWQQAARGQAILVVITGEAGIGKSRLCEEMLMWADRHDILTARTYSFTAQGELAYGPITHLLRSEALKSRVSMLPDVWLSEVARILPELVATQPQLDRPGSPGESWQRRHLFEALARVVTAANQPLLICFDDLQWSDHETIAWLHYLLQYASQARLLVLATVRGEEVGHDHPLYSLQLGLQSHGQWNEIPLAALPPTEATALAAQIRGSPLTTAESDRMYRVTEGNPLFVVESVRSGTWMPETAETGSSARLEALPSRVQAVIQARLAHLSPQARSVVNLAAAIGRSFTVDILTLAGDQEESTLLNSLDELSQRRIIREQGPSHFDFSHNLIREVAYGSVSATRRSFLHRRVAAALVAIYKDRLHEVSGRLALHCERAGQIGEAVAWYQQAADTARRIQANQLAIDYLGRALSLIDQEPSNSEWNQRQIGLLTDLGRTLKDVRGTAAPELERAYLRAWQLAEPLTKSPASLLILHGLTECYRVGADYGKARLFGDHYLELAQELADTRQQVIAHFQLGALLFTCGTLLPARSHLERSMELAPSFQTYVRRIPRLAHVLWMLGHPDQALALGRDGLLAVADSQRSFDIGDVLGEVIELRLLCGDVGAALPDLEKMLSIVHRYDFTQPITWASYLQGWALALQGSGAGIDQMHQALEAYGAVGGQTRRTRFLALLAEMCLRVGQPDRAIGYLDHADALMVRTGERFWEAELSRLRGEWTWARERDDMTAHDLFRRALDTARRQQARSLEVRAAMSMSRLWQQQGKVSEARELLSDVLNGLAEGLGTQDMRTARALLSALT